MTYLRPLRIVRAGNEGKYISVTTLAILSVPPRTFQCDPCTDQHRPCESHLCYLCKPYESLYCQCACDHSQFFLYTLWIQSYIPIVTLKVRNPKKCFNRFRKVFHSSTNCFLKLKYVLRHHKYHWVDMLKYQTRSIFTARKQSLRR